MVLVKLRECMMLSVHEEVQSPSESEVGMHCVVQEPFNCSMKQMEMGHVFNELEPPQSRKSYQEDSQWVLEVVHVIILLVAVDAVGNVNSIQMPQSTLEQVPQQSVVAELVVFGLLYEMFRGVNIFTIFFIRPFGVPHLPQQTFVVVKLELGICRRVVNDPVWLFLSDFDVQLSFSDRPYKWQIE